MKKSVSNFRLIWYPKSESEIEQNHFRSKVIILEGSLSRRILWPIVYIVLTFKAIYMGHI